MLSRIGRRAGRIAASILLAVFYAAGFGAACVVVVALTVVGAVRLGWSDVHAATKRGSHGTA